MSLWWLSFVDQAKPAGNQFLGALLIEATDFVTAIKLAWMTGCNPGGSVRGMECDPDLIAQLSFELPIGRLLSLDETCELDDRIGKDIAS